MVAVLEVQLIEDRGASKNGVPRNFTEVTMATYRKQYNQTVADYMMAVGRESGFTPLSVSEITTQAEQIKLLQELLTRERFRNVKLQVLADGLMDIIERYDMPLSESESAA
jgi:hypothetical protein